MNVMPEIVLTETRWNLYSEFADEYIGIIEAGDIVLILVRRYDSATVIHDGRLGMVYVHLHEKM